MPKRSDAYANRDRYTHANSYHDAYSQPRAYANRYSHAHGDEHARAYKDAYCNAKRYSGAHSPTHSHPAPITDSDGYAAATIAYNATDRYGASYPANVRPVVCGGWILRDTDATGATG